MYTILLKKKLRGYTSLCNGFRNAIMLDEYQFSLTRGLGYSKCKPNLSVNEN